VLLTPLRFTAGAFVVMTLFRANNTDIAARQLFHTGITKTLAKTFVGFATTVNAVNHTLEAEAYSFANQFIEANQAIANR